MPNPTISTRNLPYVNGKSDRRSPFRSLVTRRTLPKILAGCGLLVLFSHRYASYKMNTLTWVKAPINDIPRVCPAIPYPTIDTTNNPRPTICLTTLTDAAKATPFQRFIRWRNFDNLLQMTWPNKEHYVAQHDNYKLFDESPNLNTSRPPSWSKIKAARRLLTEEDCDWVFWMDADTVIMDSSRNIEDFLPLHHDLVLTTEKGGSYNAGAWLIRRSQWSLDFLDAWWSMSEFVKPPGMSTSGDNAALKAYLTQTMDPSEFQQHIAVPARCTFNSVTKFLSPTEAAAMTPELLQEQVWYLHEEYYHKGDFVAHVAGRNNKIDTTALLLPDAV